jgi:hypothetical protein
VLSERACQASGSESDPRGEDDCNESEPEPTQPKPSTTLQVPQPAPALPLPPPRKAECSVNVAAWTVKGGGWGIDNGDKLRADLEKNLNVHAKGFKFTAGRAGAGFDWTATFLSQANAKVVADIINANAGGGVAIKCAP